MTARLQLLTHCLLAMCLCAVNAVMSKVEWLTNRPMVQLGTQCAMVCMLLHWIACVWYYAATIGADGGWVHASGLVSSAGAACCRHCVELAWPDTHWTPGF